MTDPDSDLVCVGRRIAIGGVNDTVLADGHGAALDVLCYAFAGS